MAEVGRPKKEINYKLVESLASIFCTQDEIASVLDISTRTLQRDEEFNRVFKRGQEMAMSSLRRIQWKHAEKSATMAIWLGKQYLGQRDNIEVVNNEVSKLDELLKEIKDNASK